MKRSIIHVVVFFFLLSLGGCYKAQTQYPPPAGSVAGSQQDATVTGAFGEPVPEPGKASPFDQAGAVDTGANPMQTEIAGDLKPPALATIESRISEYNNKLAKWNELDSKAGTAGLSPEQAARLGTCHQELQTLLGGYKTLHNAVASGDRSDVAGNSVYNAKMQELQQRDIRFLEGDCGALLGARQMPALESQPAGPLGSRPQEEEIAALIAKRDYKGVEQAWSQIPENQRDQFSLKTKMQYAEALVFLQKEEQAAEFYRQMIDRMAGSEKQAESLALRKVLADLYVATGKFSEAQDQYVTISKEYLALGNIDNWAKIHLAILSADQKNSPELLDYSGLIRNSLGSIPEQDGYKVVWEAEKFLRTYPNSSVTANVETIKNTSQEAADKWFNAFLAEVDQLVAEKKFQEAMAKIKGMRTDIINDQQLDLLNAKNDELVLAEAVEQETSKMAKLQELEQRWNNGLMLAKSGRYDEAIAVFNALYDTDFAQKAETKIKEISENAALEDRRKAADLYIRFTKTTDIESKKKLLIESRRLLKDILVKYPRASITDKVLGNIKRVEQEMNTLDPQLLSTVDSQTTPLPPPEKVEEPPSLAPDNGFEPQPPVVEAPLGQ